MFKFVPESEVNEFIGFIVDDEPYCINIQNVQEIIDIPPISKIPNVPNYIEGAINLRGKIIRVVNLRKWLRLPWKQYTKSSRILVVNMNEQIFGLLVEGIYEVFQTEKNKVHDLPVLLGQQPDISYIKHLILEKNQIFLEVFPEKFRS